MWVLRRIPADETSWDNMSPWKGCLWIDLLGNKKAWYATRQANPTIFATEWDAEEWKKRVEVQFPESKILVAVYEEIFQESLPIPISDIGLAAATVIKVNEALSDWNWNDDSDDIPF